MPLGFLDLPGEIRNQIYSNLYLHPGIIYPLNFITARRQGYQPNLFRNWHPQPALCFDLLLTCHQIHDEACDILYGRNTFRFISERENAPNDGYSCVRHFMDTIGQDNRQRVRHVEMELNTDAKADAFSSLQDSTSQESWLFCGEPSHLKIALAVLTTCFRLGTLAITFLYKAFRYDFTFILDDSIITGRRALFRQLMLELSATLKAFEQCHNVPPY